MKFVVINEKEGINLENATDWEMKQVPPLGMNVEQGQKEGKMEDRLTIRFIGDNTMPYVAYNEEARVLHTYLVSSAYHRLSISKGEV